MNSRERVLCSIEWQEPDRVPVEIYLTPEMKTRLKEYLQCDDVLDFLESDFRRIAPAYQPPPGCDRREQQKHNNVKITTSGGATYTESATFPLADVKTTDELDSFQWPWWSYPEDFDYSVIPALIEAKKDYAVCIGGEGFPDILNSLSGLRGMEQVMIDVALRDEVGMEIIDRFVQRKYEQIKRTFEAAGKGGIDILRMGEDCGNQSGRMFSEKDFNEVFRPKLQMFIDLAHEYGAKVMLHSCGDTHEIMPTFMEMGVDVLDAMQPEPPGMRQIENLRQMCYGKMAFCGLISTQQTLPHGTVADCRKEARHRLNVIGKGGGYIFAPAHCIQPDTPIENVLAIYEEALGRKLIKKKMTVAV